MPNLPANAGDMTDMGSILGSGRSPRGGKGNPLQYCCLENSIDRGAWWATVHGVANSLIRLGKWAHIRAFVIKCFQYGTKRFWGSNRIFKELLVWKLGNSGLFLVYLNAEMEGMLHKWKPGFFQCYEPSHGHLLITYMPELQIKMGLYVFHHSRVNLVY